MKTMPCTRSAPAEVSLISRNVLLLVQATDVCFNCKCLARAAVGKASCSELPTVSGRGELLLICAEKTSMELEQHRT